MKFFDNVTNIVRDDMTETITQGSRVSIAAACFSMYAYNELKKQLEGVDELRFIFTSPTFVTEKESKQKREFYIPKHHREQSLYGTEFEVKLRNELNQKAIAKECAEWIRKKVTFRSNVSQEMMQGFINVDESTYLPINGFTTVHEYENSGLRKTASALGNSGTRWTKEEKAMLIALYEQEESYERIGKDLRRTPFEIQEKLEMMGYRGKKRD